MELFEAKIAAPEVFLLELEDGFIVKKKTLFPSGVIDIFEEKSKYEPLVDVDKLDDKPNL